MVGWRCQRRESSAQKQERGSRAVHSRNATTFNDHLSLQHAHYATPLFPFYSSLQRRLLWNTPFHFWLVITEAPYGMPLSFFGSSLRARPAIPHHEEPNKKEQFPRLKDLQ
ncbi:MAG: hypothetical protein ACRCZB_00675 [Bacteroidales bacterium]